MISSASPKSGPHYATELLLASIFYLRSPERSFHSFIINKPGERHLVSGLGIEVNYNDKAIADVVLYLRRHAAPHLRSLSVSEVRSFLTEFVSDNFWIISNEAWGERSEKSFNDFLSDGAKQALAEAMSVSNLYIEPRKLTLFPLTVVRIENRFISSDFFLTSPETLTPELMESDVSQNEISTDHFPPFTNSEHRKKPVTSWLGIWAPNVETARRLRATVLGAIALLPHHMERYQFTGREIVPGRCTLQGCSYSISIGDPHTPALGDDVSISESDHSWLAMLADKLISPAKLHKKQMRSLEYQYRAWVPDATRRFPTLFAALDAIYGDAGQATQAIVNAVCPVMGSEYNYERLKLLLSLRASVIHGGAPNVYESSSYHKYYEKYYSDATRDLELTCIPKM